MHNLTKKFHESKMYLAMSRKILRKIFPLKYKAIEINPAYQIWSMDKRKRYFIN